MSTIPQFRAPQILEGPRSSGVERPTNYQLITSLVRHAPAKGEYVFFSPSAQFRILLRGAKTTKDRDGRVIGEVEPLEAVFDRGQLRTFDQDMGELLLKNKSRNKSYFAYDDVVEMKDQSDERTMDSFLSSASPEVVEKLKVRLGAKSFNLKSEK